MCMIQGGELHAPAIFASVASVASLVADFFDEYLGDYSVEVCRRQANSLWTLHLLSLGQASSGAWGPGPRLSSACVSPMQRFMTTVSPAASAICRASSETIPTWSHSTF